MIASYKISRLNYEKRFHVTTARNPGYIRSLLIGSILALGWTPSIGAVLGAILTYAYISPDILKIVTLLSCYSIGFGVPFIIMGLMWGALTPLWKYINRYLVIVSLLSGLVLIIIGILMLTANLSWLMQLM
jgi:cytochrome c-type biogenesis protein